MVNEPPLDLTQCEQLAAQGAAGTAAASTALVHVLWPWLTVLVRTNRSMRGLREGDDHVHDVVVAIVEKITRGIHLYPPWREANSDKTLLDWCRILSKNAIRDHLRSLLGPRPIEGEISAKRLLNEFIAFEEVEEQGERPPRTAAETARELVEFAKAQLPASQFLALGRWLEGESAEEIGRAMGTPTEDAQRLLRAAIATLRRQFVEN